MFCKFPAPSDNKAGCNKSLDYLSKEDKNRGDDNELKGFFSSDQTNLSKDDAQKTIEHSYYKKGLKSDQDKHFMVVVSFSKDELKGKSNEELIKYAQKNFANDYAASVTGREVDPKSIAWIGKVEENRKYKGFDKEVKEGNAKSGQIKEGDNRHIHFIVSRKTLDDKQISPHSNHFKSGTNSGAVKGGFDQDIFKLNTEKSFDKEFSHSREKKDMVQEKLKPYRKDLSAKDYTPIKADSLLEKIKTSFNKTKELAKSLFFNQNKPMKTAEEKNIKPEKTQSKSVLDKLNEKTQERQNEQSKEQDQNKDKGLSR